MENNADSLEPTPETCASCGAKLKGNYCRKCGEKKIVPERDFSVAKFLMQTFGHAIHFDSKIWRSYWLLFSKPGFLTAEWVAGRRVRYMKPLQLFVIAGILFYFFLPTVPAHFSHIRDLKLGFETRDWVLNTWQYDVSDALLEKARAAQISADDLADEIDKAAAKQSKTWLFLIIPFWGGLIYPFFRKKNAWLVPHLIFALHGLTYYILADLLIHFILNVLGMPPIGRHMMMLLLLAYFPYLLIAVQRVYSISWPEAFAKTAAIEIGLLVLLIFYRQLITIWTLIFFGE